VQSVLSQVDGPTRGGRTASPPSMSPWRRAQGPLPVRAQGASQTLNFRSRRSPIPPWGISSPGSPGTAIITRMITYDPKRWFRLLFHWAGTVLPRVLPRVVSFGLLATAAVLFHTHVFELHTFDAVGHT